MKQTAILVIALIIIQSQPGFSQLSIKVGDPAPSITVTDWVQNTPADTSLAQKIVVIDFWATWCGPCIKAVPHYNELVAEFAGEPDILFLSMTYENPLKVRRTLERIDFRSAVVTDQTNQTQEAFGIGEIPYTLVISKTGKLVWHGHPESLTADILRDVASDKAVLVVSQSDEESESVDVTGENLGLKAFSAGLKDPDVVNMFQIIPTTEEGGLRVMNLPRLYFEAGADMRGTLSQFLAVPEYRIRIPEVLERERFNIAFIDKVTEGRSKEEAARSLLSRLLEEYGLKMSSEERTVAALQITVANASRLKSADEGPGNISDAGDKVIFTGQSLQTVLFELESRLEQPLVDQTGLAGAYDFIIEIGNREKILESLESYGLSTKPTSTTAAFYELTTQ